MSFGHCGTPHVQEWWPPDQNYIFWKFLKLLCGKNLQKSGDVYLFKFTAGYDLAS